MSPEVSRIYYIPPSCLLSIIVIYSALVFYYIYCIALLTFQQFQGNKKYEAVPEKVPGPAGDHFGKGRQHPGADSPLPFSLPLPLLLESSEPPPLHC